MPQHDIHDAVTLDIDRLSYGPYGIGRHSGKAVMIPHTAPGDQIAARIVEATLCCGRGNSLDFTIATAPNAALSILRGLRRLLLAACSI